MHEMLRRCLGLDLNLASDLQNPYPKSHAENDF